MENITQKAQFNPEIFKAYDIRGVYGQDFDEDFAFRLGAALVAHLNRTRFLVGHDDREFSPRLAQAVAHGMISAGGDVEYVGQTATPLFNFVFNKLGVNGGIMVTASHVAQYRGFKVLGDKGEVLGLNTGLEQIKKIIERDNFATAKRSGKMNHLIRASLIADYADFIISKSGAQNENFNDLKIKVDILPIQKEETEMLLAKFGIRNVGDNYDIAFSFDADADRLRIFDGEGEPVHADYVVGLLAGDMVRWWSKPKAVHDFRFSRGVLEKLRQWGVRAFPSRVGWKFLKENAVKHKADIAGELSGHIMWRETNYAETPLLTMLKILKIMKQAGKSINELMMPFQTWANSGEINTAFSGGHLAFSELAKRIKGKYRNERINELDGVTIEHDDPAPAPGGLREGANWWFNVRPSNTEPIVRIVVEAKTKNLLNEKVAEIKALVGT